MTEHQRKSDGDAKKSEFARYLASIPVGDSDESDDDSMEEEATSRVMNENSGDDTGDDIEKAPGRCPRKKKNCCARSKSHGLSKCCENDAHTRRPPNTEKRDPNFLKMLNGSKLSAVWRRTVSYWVRKIGIRKHLISMISELIVKLPTSGSSRTLN